MASFADYLWFIIGFSFAAIPTMWVVANLRRFEDRSFTTPVAVGASYMAIRSFFSYIFLLLFPDFGINTIESVVGPTLGLILFFIPDIVLFSILIKLFYRSNIRNTSNMNKKSLLSLLLTIVIFVVFLIIALYLLGGILAAILLRGCC